MKKLKSRFGTVAIGAMLLSLLSVAASADLPPGIETNGPDVTINLLDSVDNYGGSGGIRGYAVGTTSCNIGTQPVNWCINGGGCGPLTEKQHPVIAQGLYRLKDNRLEQIGMSWLKHGFVSTNSTEGFCKQNDSCIQPPLGGNQLGVGCRDTYWAGLNGSRPLGMRSEVNVTIGDLDPFPITVVDADEEYEQRVKVLDSDVDPDLNPGALYWVEGQYIADNDALGGNGMNNASHRRVIVDEPTLNLDLTGAIIRERSAIHAWKAQDPTVEMYNIDVPGTPPQRFELARRVNQVDGNTWHYEYAIRNMNSDRAAGSFAVDFANGTPIANVGFKDIEHHSGEPYATTDWNATVSGAAGSVTWATEAFGSNPDANALRWATMFNFWFDADAPPGGAVHTLSFFKPGPLGSLNFVLPIFADAFESNNLTAWSSVTP